MFLIFIKCIIKYFPIYYIILFETKSKQKIFFFMQKKLNCNFQELYLSFCSLNDVNLVKQSTRDRRSEGRDDVAGDVSELVLGVVALVGGV